MVSYKYQCKQDIREGEIQILSYNQRHKKQTRASQELRGCETERFALFSGVAGWPENGETRQQNRAVVCQTSSLKKC